MNSTRNAALAAAAARQGIPAALTPTLQAVDAAVQARRARGELHTPEQLTDTFARVALLDDISDRALFGTCLADALCESGDATDADDESSDACRLLRPIWEFLPSEVNVVLAVAEAAYRRLGGSYIDPAPGA